ncbi:MAG: hypothetical protein HZA61_10365 [Candidatus Eisenbacteria bacterium]|uniref:Galactose oxidase n=1 Tax=Eiseniibacteriota bacterium TaxID=2212470 RepID=A0A933SEH6_UNCEI|nr:hypothetical protein [Candidatus Eisenbacteria bacterium]
MPRRRVVLACLLAGLATAASVSATILHPGKWTQNAQVHRVFATAVNLMLLPGTDPTNPVQSQILWWADDHSAPIVGEPDGNHGGRFDWWPDSDASLNSGNFPDTTHGPSGTFVSDVLEETGFNIFCSGLGHLPSGLGFVVGGTTEAENGETRAATYDPVTKQWTVLTGQMQAGRWYPTATTLPDGRMLITTSGSQYRHVWMFGGAENDIQLQRMPVSHTKGWELGVIPSFDSYVSWAARVPPVPRRGHTASFSLGSRQAIFGGQKSDGSGMLNDLWLLARDENQGGSNYQYLWHRRTPATESPVSPTARAFHSAVSPNDGEMVIFGGLSVTQQALNDVWGVTLKNNSTEAYWINRLPTASSEPFPARFGQAVVWHKDPSNVVANDCAYVYGGSGNLGSLPTDNAVYRMKLVGTDQVEWTKCTVENPTVGPGPRMFMATGLINRARVANGPEINGMVVYGGRTFENQVSDSLFVLWITGPTTVRWQPVAQSGTRPPRAGERGRRGHRELGGVLAVGRKDGRWNRET